MAPYRLSPSLGGHIVQGQEVPDGVRVVLDGATLVLPAALATRVWPAEPTFRVDGLTFVVIDHGDDGCDVFRRLDDAAVDPAEPWLWFVGANDTYVSWRFICERGTPVTLLPRMASGSRGICPVCKQDKPLNTDGHLRQHGGRSYSSGCTGSGQLPLSGGE
jgi:hypothetical protein